MCHTFKYQRGQNKTLNGQLTFKTRLQILTLNTKNTVFLRVQSSDVQSILQHLTCHPGVATKLFSNTPDSHLAVHDNRSIQATEQVLQTNEAALLHSDQATVLRHK